MLNVKILNEVKYKNSMFKYQITIPVIPYQIILLAQYFNLFPFQIDIDQASKRKQIQEICTFI